MSETDHWEKYASAIFISCLVNYLLMSFAHFFSLGLFSFSY